MADGLFSDESSTKICVSANRVFAFQSFFQSSAVSSPFSAFAIFTFATEQSILCASCTFGISSENTAHFAPLLSAALVTIFIAKDVLPTPGRAANKIKSEFCKPLVISSNWKKPVDSPRKAFLSL